MTPFDSQPLRWGDEPRLPEMPRLEQFAPVWRTRTSFETCGPDIPACGRTGTRRTAERRGTGGPSGENPRLPRYAA